MVNWRSPSVKYFFRESIAEGPECLCFWFLNLPKDKSRPLLCRSSQQVTLLSAKPRIPPWQNTKAELPDGPRGKHTLWSQGQGHTPDHIHFSLLDTSPLKAQLFLTQSRPSRAHVTYCLHSPHTVTSSLTLVVLSVDSTAGCSQEQLMDFFFSFSLLRFIFFGWSYRPFVLGQSVPPPPHLPGGFQRNPLLSSASAAAATAGPKPESRPRRRHRPA